MYLLLGPVQISSFNSGFQACWPAIDGTQITTSITGDWEDWILSHLTPEQLSGVQGSWLPLSIFWESKEWQKVVRIEFEEYGAVGNFEKLSNAIEFIKAH